MTKDKWVLTCCCAVQGLDYVFSFVWKPPILIAWKPRADLDREAMDPARDTVVSSLYKVSFMLHFSHRCCYLDL